MPEGPQVYRIAEKLKEVLLRPPIILESVTTYSPEEVETINSKVTRIFTKGKRAVIALENGRGVLLIFALSGRIDYYSANILPPITEATVAMLSFSSGLNIILSDPQHLASVVVDTIPTIVKTMLAKGFDPMHTITGMREWISVCRKHPSHLIATFITDQDVVAGIGNRYRSEILHGAGIDPRARIRDLSDEQLEILLVTIYRILKAASRDQYTFSVYGRKETPTGKPVKRIEVAKGVNVWTTRFSSNPDSGSE